MKMDVEGSRKGCWWWTDPSHIQLWAISRPTQMGSSPFGVILLIFDPCSSQHSHPKCLVYRSSCEQKTTHGWYDLVHDGMAAETCIRQGGFAKNTGSWSSSSHSVPTMNQSRRKELKMKSTGPILSELVNIWVCPITWFLLLSMIP